jgi:rRNA maturation RNase YbeY
MKISILNPTERIVRAPELRALTAYLMTRALSRSGPRAWGEIDVVLLDDAAIAGANARVFGRETPTDVISQAYRPAPGCKAWTGEILVNAERAGRHDSPASELALYIAHGCDHLCGGRDGTPAARRRMLDRERRWLRDARRAGLPVDRLLVRPRHPR